MIIAMLLGVGAVVAGARGGTAISARNAGTAALGPQEMIQPLAARPTSASRKKTPTAPGSNS